MLPKSTPPKHRQSTELILTPPPSEFSPVSSLELEPATRIALDKLRKVAAEDTKKRKESKRLCTSTLDISSISNISNSFTTHQMTIGERTFSENINSTPLMSRVRQDLTEELDLSVAENVEEKDKEKTGDTTKIEVETVAEKLNTKEKNVDAKVANAQNVEEKDNKEKKEAENGEEKLNMKEKS